MKKYTPAMQQYVDLKKQYHDCIVLFRLGDFYEVFFEDAKLVSSLLDLVLTAKNKNAPDPIPMAGMPHHSVEKYITKLVSLGYKVALAEQLTAPSPGTIVQRDVVQVITPGTAIDEHSNEYAYVCAVTKQDQTYHIAWGDFSLGSYSTKSFVNLSALQGFLYSLAPQEIIVDAVWDEKDHFQDTLPGADTITFSTHDVPSRPQEYITRVCQLQTITSFGKAVTQGREKAFALLVYYLYYTQKKPLVTVQQVRFHHDKDFVLLDPITLKNLEVFHASYEHDPRYSLFGVINRCKTGAGSRLLRDFLSRPSQNIQTIHDRQSHISYYREHHATRTIHQLLAYICDIQKTCGTIFYRKALPAVFARLRKTLALFLGKHDHINNNVPLDVLLQECQRLGLSDMILAHIQEIHTRLHQVFHDDEALHNEKNFIRVGYDAQVDELRRIAYNADEVLLQYQSYVQEQSGVSCKVKFVSNQGYCIEVSQKDVATFEKAILPEDDKLGFVRKHTLKSAQRYASIYLSGMEQEIIAAKDSLLAREWELLYQVRDYLMTEQQSLTVLADVLASLDVFSSQALLSLDKKFVQPDIVDESTLVIQDGRHPVIEEFLPRDVSFIPNDLRMGEQEQTIDHAGLIHIVTGPNMGGKSTFLRQNALIVLLAHCGLYVPARAARIGIVDGIFARVGSGDIIAKNQSTFMTEMIEVANILHNATERSFIIFDELGRGTSTYDGMALTKTILEYILETIQAKTLLATHYHELVSLENISSLIKNFSVSVYETDKEVIFLKKIAEGGANKSYGIDVAKLAGLPETIIQKSRKHLQELETQGTDTVAHYHSPAPLFEVVTPSAQPSMSEEERTVLESLKDVSIESMTPLEALTLLNTLKKKLS